MDSHVPFTQSPRPLRIACYGFADRSAGSVSSAGFVILDQMLRRGHHIDFYGKTSFFRPRDLETHGNFKFIEVEEPRTDRFATWLRRRRTGVFAYLMAQVAHREFAANIMREMRQQHLKVNYDVQLLLGDWAWARVKGIPVVSWVQGPPETDAGSISRRKSEIVRLCGWKTYLPMRAFAIYRHLFGLPAFDQSDLIILGSRWSRERLATYGVDSSMIESLPYPTDLSAFTPSPTLIDGPPLVLWVGRTVPRKRLDLFLDACGLLIKQGSPLRAMIVGGFGHFSGYRRLINDFQNQYPNRLEYVEQIPRDSVVGLFQKATVLVQPSEDENFGSAVAEALACGTPVVLGSSNGTGDYAKSGAIRFDQYEANAVAAAIALAITKADALREPARQAAELHLDPKTIALGLEKILIQALLAWPSKREPSHSMAGKSSFVPDLNPSGS